MNKLPRNEKPVDVGLKPAAFFDVDGTLASTNIILTYLAFRNHGSSFLMTIMRILWMIPKVPYYMVLDRIDRDNFCEIFYRKYAGVDLIELNTWADNTRGTYWDPKLYPDALEKIKQHRIKGHRIVLISGSLAPVLKPLAESLNVDALLATEPEIENGKLTGSIFDGPLSGERKAKAMEDISRKLGLDVKLSFGYGDSYSDVEFLQAVGNPVVINPDRRLKILAKRIGWPVLQWRH